MSLPILYKVKQVAEYLMVDVDIVTRLIRNRELAAKKVGREWRITEEDIQDYLDSKKITRRKSPPWKY